MGSLRRGLILSLLPGTAWAEVCDKERPNWVPGTEATAWTEMIALFTTPSSLALLLVTALAVRFRSMWGGVVAAVLWAILVSVVAFLPPNAIKEQAISEGCIGSSTLFIAVVAAICVAMILYTAPKTERMD